MGDYFTKDGFKITITTDADKAKRQLEAVADTARRATRRISLMNEGDNWDGNGNPPPQATPYRHKTHTGRFYSASTAWGAQLGLASQELGKRRFSSPHEAKRAGIIQAREIKRELISGANAIGSAIGYFLIRDVAQTYFMQKYKVGGNNVALERKQSQFETGASSFLNAAGSIGGVLMTLGSMGMKFKHPAAMIGGGLAAAAGWGLTSAFNAGKQHDIQQRDKRLAEEMSLRNTQKSADRSWEFQKRDYAIQRLNETSSGRADRIALANRELNTSTSMFKHLELEYNKRLKGIGRFKVGDAFTEEGQRVKERMEEYRSRMYSARFSLMREKDMRLPTPASAEAYTDSLSARGMFVGGTVDVVGVQKAMLEQLKGQRSNWDKQLRVLDEISATLKRRDLHGIAANERTSLIITN
jgi:hypothetical protein